MNRLALVTFAIGGVLAATGNGAGGDKGTTKTYDGTWVAVGMEQGGMKLPAEAVEKLSIKLTIKGEKYTVTFGDKVVDQGTSTIDAKKKPHEVDIKADEGANKGKTILAIVEVKGDSMKACYDMEGKGRPTDFAGKEGTGHVLILYKREAKQKD